MIRYITKNKEQALLIFFSILIVSLWCLPTGFEKRIDGKAVHCKGEILSVSNDEVQQIGMIKKGYQGLKIEIQNGKYKGRTVEAGNQLLGRMDIDKLFQEGDKALLVLTVNAQGEIIFVNPQDHFRIHLELILFGLFVFLLILFGGWTGVRALLSFILTALMIWKVMIPLFLNGMDPVVVSMFAVSALCGMIIFIVAGFNKKGLAAFSGAFFGVLTSCLLAIYFTDKFHVHGAVMPFAETLLYSGFGHLDLTRIYVAAVFIAASGAVMDLAMDVAASMHEIVEKKPDISTGEVFLSGLNVGRAVVGTMTTTLLLAYSGGFITLLMAFMAQGIPLTNVFNIIYVAAEVLKTLVGSFGLVTVAPFTAAAGAFLFTYPKSRIKDQKLTPSTAISA